jgi:hypothetical protein
MAGARRVRRAALSNNAVSYSRVEFAESTAALAGDEAAKGHDIGDGKAVALPPHSKRAWRGVRVSWSAVPQARERCLGGWGGSTAVPAVVSGRDRRGRLCSLEKAEGWRADTFGRCRFRRGRR